MHSEGKDGQDVGTLVGRDPIGITATRDVDALLAADADCVVYSPIFVDTDVVTRILESHKNVVTPLGWFYPRPTSGRGSMRFAAPRVSPCTAPASTQAGSPSVSP